MSIGRGRKGQLLLLFGEERERVEGYTNPERSMKKTAAVWMVFWAWRYRLVTKTVA